MTFPSLVVEFSPGEGPFDTPVWVDISDLVLAASWEIGRMDELEPFPQGEATIVLKNGDRLFDPEYTAGTYYGLLLPRVPFRIRATHSAVTYDLFYGFVEGGWEQTWHPPSWSTCTVKLVDMLGVIAGYTLPSVFESEVLTDNPVAFWPLDETSGAAMRDASGNVRDGTYVDGSTRLASTLESVNGALTAGLELDGEHWGSLRDLSATVHARPACIEIVFKPNDVAVTQIMYRSGTGNANEGNTIQYSGAGTSWQIAGAIRDGDADNLAYTPSTYSTRGGEGALHHYVLQRPAAGAANAWLDGENVTSITATAPSNGISVAPGSVIGAADYQSSPATTGGDPADPYYGFIGGVAIYDTDIGDARIAAHATAALAPYDGDTPDIHIGWILDEVGVPAGTRDLDVPDLSMGPLNSKGRNALELLREIADTEQGFIYVNHADGGKVAFRGRYSRVIDTRSATVQAIFTDDTGALPAGSFSYQNLRVDANGVAGVINQVDADWGGGTVRVSDATSVAAYGPQTRTVTIAARNPNVARSAAEWLVYRYKDPKTRVRSLDLTPAVDAEYAAVLDAEVGDRLTVERHPQATGTQTSYSVIVEGIEHQVPSPGVWLTSLHLSEAPATDSVWIWGTSAWGETKTWG